MNKLTVTELSLEDFDKRLEIAYQKIFQLGKEEGKKEKKENPVYFTIMELQERWKCSDGTITNYETRYGDKSLKRKIIGGLIRFKFQEVERFENFQDLEIHK